MTRNVNLSMRAFIMALVGVAVVAGALVAGGFAIGYSKAPILSTGTAQRPALDPDMSQVASVELVPGTGDGERGSRDAEYRCAAGFMPVQIPIGTTDRPALDKVDSSSFSLAEKKEYDTQKSVTLKIKLGAALSAPSAIINTEGHHRAPTLYPQHVLQLALTPEGTGEYTLDSKAYDENYTNIIDVTVCTTKK